MSNETETVEHEYERIVLQKIKLTATEMMPGGLHDVLANTTFEIQADRMADRFIAQMATYVWGMNERRLKSRWPTDWKQAVKLRFAPAWFRRRWPVRYHEIDEPQFEAVYLSLHGDKITADPSRGGSRVEFAELKGTPK